MKTYKTIKTLLPIAAIAAVIVIAGCDTTGLPTEEVNVSYDLMEMRAMIPVIEAGLMVTIPDDSMGSSSFSIRTYTAPGGVEPIEIYGTPDLGSTVRYPAGAAYLEDFYGVAGNRAYLELTPDDNTDLYRVDLFIYPTLSTTVDYVHEAYLVIADPEDGVEVPWALVDATGADAPLNYLVNETVYYDGRTQTTDVEWSRYSDIPATDLYYAIPDAVSRVPDDFEDPVYDFPLDPGTADPAKTAAVAGQYSAKSVSTIMEQGMTVTEYYTDSDPESDGNYEIFSVSYVDRDDAVTVTGNKSMTISEKTVRRYYQDEAGGKTVRARTEADMNYDGRFSSSTVVTEAIDITDDGSSPIAFDSIISAYEAASGDEIYVITIDLNETGAGTNEFTGTMVHELADRQPVTYEITLDSSTGITVRATGTRKTQGNFNGFSRQEYRDFVFALSNEGTFTGKMKGGAIQGVYKQLTEEVDVYLGLAILLGVADSGTTFK